MHLGPGRLKVRSLDLGELSPSGCRKLRALDRFRELKNLPEEAWQRSLVHFGGHPKALELFEGFLREQPDRARQLLSGMGPAVAAVDEDLKAEQQDRGRKLLVENVLATVPPERRPAFDRLCLLEAPLPTEELEALLTAEGIAGAAGDLGWLRDHGFLARTVAPSALTGGDAIHRLLASRQQEALADREGPEVARAWHLRVAEHLVQPGRPLSDYGIAARHRDAAGDRAGALGLYDQWALALRGRHAYSACLQIAQEGLQAFPAGEAEAEQVGAAQLWVSKHDALKLLGRIEEAVQALETAFGLIADGTSTEAKFFQAGIQMLQGRLLAQEGRLQRALDRFEAAQAGFENGGHLRERAIALGDVALLRAQGGDVAGALKLHEERLSIFEQLGDVRERAVALGDVARLRARGGDVAGALKLHEEYLKVSRQLGDIEAIAGAQNDLAQLELKQGNRVGALERLAESWNLVCRIGRADGIAVVGQLYGQLLAETDPSRALEILRTSREAFRVLGWTAEVNEVDELIGKLEQPEQPPEHRPTL
ncbi:MAG TPA: hypothetical protein VEW48_03200 [Thermoanaerobaculia bacterium]|nr:hypothetical protein [Thermoanaerobaculia bacterium]